MRYLCDLDRHLICDPYNIPNLHAMARSLGIGRWWFHNTPGLAHYDIPKYRQEEIRSKCVLIPTKELVKMIHEATGRGRTNSTQGEEEEHKEMV